MSIESTPWYYSYISYSSYFQLDSRNLEINVNSFEVTNFWQILTLSRAIRYGNVRFISSRDLIKYFANYHPRFRFPLWGGERSISAPSSQKYYAFKIWTNVLHEESSQNIIRLVGFLSFCCWYSIRPLLVQVITIFDFKTKSFYHLFVEFTKRK